MLVVHNVHLDIGENLILKGISLQVGKGERIAVLGANGAGKTSLIKAIMGLLPIKSGQILFNGKKIHSLPPYEIAELGIACVPEGRRVFADMTVKDNLLMGAYLPHARNKIKETIDQVLSLFPILKERMNQRAGTLSGGEQQMLAIGRAMMSRPQLLIIDELSLGLAPVVVQEIYRVISKLSEDVSLLIVEQNVEIALNNTNFAYILEVGSVVRKGKSSDLLRDPSIKEAYLGM